MKSMMELIDDMIYYNDILDDSDITNYSFNGLHCINTF